MPPNVDDAFDSFDPEKDSIIDMVKKFRGMTGRRLNLLENYLVTEKRAAKDFRATKSGNHVFNLSEDQIKFTYPASHYPGFHFESQYDQDFSEENAKVLDKLVPEIYPDEDYFEEEEKPCIFGNDHPMSSSPADYISRLSILISINLFFKDNTGHQIHRLFFPTELDNALINSPNTKLRF